jgi:uncharacterized protein DUF488
MTQSAIAYLAVPDLAPTQQMRELQRTADAEAKTRKSDRTELAPVFKEAYAESVLTPFSSDDLADLFRRCGDRPCLFCVERSPEACHRSLAANWISLQTNAPIVDLTP